MRASCQTHSTMFVTSHSHNEYSTAPGHVVPPPLSALAGPSTVKAGEGAEALEVGESPTLEYSNSQPLFSE